MILLVLLLGLGMIARWDRPLKLKKSARKWVLAGAVTEGICIEIVCAGESSLCVRFLWCILGGCLLFACVTDMMTCQVYNFTWLFYLVAVFLLWCCQEVSARGGGLDCARIGELMVYLGSQLLMAGRIYGRADSYAFCSCAFAEALLGITAKGFLIHMLFAYLFLFIVQLARRNMNKRGNLRRPVPFLPYITAAFWTTVVLCG